MCGIIKLVVGEWRKKGKMEMYDILAKALEKLENFDLDVTFDKVDEKQLENEVENMVDFMSKKIEDIRTVDVKQLCIDLIDHAIEIVFIFTAPNITLKDNRCYTIRLNY
jgi:hypothetical protein